MLERALELLLGQDAPLFEVLGKPSAGHFHAALNRLGVRDAVMIGDQLRTDVAGAKLAGIASAIVLTGVTTRAAALAAGEAAPDYLLAHLGD
jgi:glycerol-1-phosphatase